MMNKDKRVRAFCMLSGGLDSQLAICVLRDQGIEVHAVVFSSPFFEIAAAVRASKALDIPLRIVDFTADIVELVTSPPHGYGSCMNPCKDCHARMLKRTGDMMVAEGFDFISTGEVLNQRPMSQNRSALALVAKESGYPDLIVRPLSAQHLPETLPEREGLVDRSRLLALHGRQRKPQFELAKQLGVEDYPSPAGGCRLTEPNYSRRLRDLLDHEGLQETRVIELLRLGRQMRLPSGAKLIVGRDHQDNLKLEESASAEDVLISLVDIPGPTALLVGGGTDEDIELAGGICADYGDCDGAVIVTVLIRRAGEEIQSEVPVADREEVRSWIL